jgi:cholesterol transport system auxiliary component
MKPLSIRCALPALVLSAILATACATGPATPALFDLGPMRPAPGQVRQSELPPIALAEPRSSAWLSSPMMYYRLLYANDRQPRPYTESRWLMPPPQLFKQRLAAQIADAGGVVTSAQDTGPSLPVLQLEIDEFSHIFTAPDTSFGRLSIRVSVFRGRDLVAQRTFQQNVPAPTDDASGGALALSIASDAAIADILQWLSTLPTLSTPKK